MPLGLRRFLAGGGVAIVALGACSSETEGRASGPPFCADLEASGLTTLQVSDPGGATVAAQRFEQLTPAAPPEIRDEWRRLTELFRAVGSLDAADPGFRSAVLAEVGRTQTAATEVTAWVQRSCELDLGAAPGPTTTAPAPAPPAAPAPETTSSPAPASPVESTVAMAPMPG